MKPQAHFFLTYKFFRKAVYPSTPSEILDGTYADFRTETLPHA